LVLIFVASTCSPFTAHLIYRDFFTFTIFSGEIIIIIIIIINCNWVVTRWQWLFYMYKKYEIGY